MTESWATTSPQPVLQPASTKLSIISRPLLPSTPLCSSTFARILGVPHPTHGLSHPATVSTVSAKANAGLTVPEQAPPSSFQNICSAPQLQAAPRTLTIC